VLTSFAYRTERTTFVTPETVTTIIGFYQAALAKDKWEEDPDPATSLNRHFFWVYPGQGTYGLGVVLDLRPTPLMSVTLTLTEELSR